MTAPIFGHLDGATVPGGCDLCDAYQEIAAPAFALPGVVHIRIRHDLWCPDLARRERRELTREQRRTANRFAQRQARRSS